MKGRKYLKLIRGTHYDSTDFHYDVSTLAFNTVITCATIQVGRNWPDWKVTGRLVQVRKNREKYGSTHLFFIRRCDGSLFTFYNESVYVLNEEGIKYVDQFFTEVDIPDKEYILRKTKMTGFVVDEP